MATFAETMVTTLEAALLADPLAKSVSVDGTTISYADAVERLATFRRQVAREAGTKPPMARINLRGW